MGNSLSLRKSPGMMKDNHGYEEGPKPPYFFYRNIISERPLDSTCVDFSFVAALRLWPLF